MNRFFLTRESPRPAALLRIVLGAILLCEAAARWASSVELYSSDGQPMPVFPGTFLEPRAADATSTVLLHTTLIWALVSVTFGWNTRLSLLLAAILSTWLGLLDLPGTYKKYSALSLHLLLLLSLTNSGGVWSTDAWIRRRLMMQDPDSPVWPRRLMQILLCSVYLGAAVTKLQLPEIANGELLEFWLLGDLFGGRTAGRWLVKFPSLLAVASVLTVILELTFPVLIWVRRLRLPMLLLAAAFHLTLAALMHLGLFSWIMLAGLLSFLTDEDLTFMSAWLRELPALRDATGRFDESGRRAFQLLVWIGAAVCVVGAGLLVQRSADWYGVFGSRDARPRKDIPAALAAEMLKSAPPPYTNYIHRLEAGRRIRNGRAFGGTFGFRPGDVVHTVVRLVQPHPAFRLDWLLIAPDGEEIARLGSSINSTAARASGGFELTDDAPPGRYRIILQADGYDIGEITMEVSDSP